MAVPPAVRFVRRALIIGVDAHRMPQRRPDMSYRWVFHLAPVRPVGREAFGTLHDTSVDGGVRMEERKTESTRKGGTHGKCISPQRRSVASDRRCWPCYSLWTSRS